MSFIIIIVGTLGISGGNSAAAGFWSGSIVVLAPVLNSFVFLDTTGETNVLIASIVEEVTYLCLLFIHPGAPNLISLRSAGTMPA